MRVVTLRLCSHAWPTATIELLVRPRNNCVKPLSTPCLKTVQTYFFVRTLSNFGYRTLRPHDISASRHSGTLRHRSQDIRHQKTWYETLRHECRDRGKAGTLRPRTIPMRHFGTNFVMPKCLGAEVSCRRSVRLPKFRPIVEFFCTKVAKRTSFSEIYSFSTSPNLYQRTTVLNADVPNCYITL